jgi:hypothetical protein
LRFDAKEPEIYLLPRRGTNGSGQYQLVYPTDIELYGASFNTYVADDEVAGELSLRQNAPLDSVPVVVPGRELADNGANARYAVGDTLQGQVSEHHIFAAGALWQRAEFSVEIAANDRLDVTRNATALDPKRDGFATAFEATFEPQYFEVLPSLDLSLPITFGHGLIGRSSTQEAQDFPGAGELSFGVSATYRSVWQASLSMTHFIGAPTSQWLRDRDFVAFTVQRTF